MFDRINFLVSEALIALRRNGWMTFACLSTVCMALFLTGGVGFAYRGITRYAEQLPSRFEMSIYMKDGVSETQVKSTVEKIQQLAGVKRVFWIPKTKAWQEFKRANPEFPTSDLENPLPETLRVTLSDITKADAIAEAAKKMPDVSPNEVLYLKEEGQMLTQALGFLRTLGLTLGMLMLITSGILIYNAIRSTINARAREFRIMSLVGASSSTIRIPLLLEGILSGLVGGVLAALLVQGSHWYLSEQLRAFSGIIKLGALEFGEVLWVHTVGGAIYGFVCSLIAVRSFQGE